jgi:hypothetical protein
MYDRYGLTSNPFVCDEPLEVPPCSANHFLTVEGFGEQKPLIDNLAKAEYQLLLEETAAASQENPVNTDISKTRRAQFVLIHGNSGTGRTSVSNYVSHMFSEARSQLKVVELINDSAFKLNLYQWMEAFSLKASINGFVGIPELFARVGNFDSVTPTRYISFLHGALSEMRSAPSGIRVIAIFENVKNAQLFPLVQDVFDPVNIALPDPPLVIFTTSDAMVSDAFLSLARRPLGPGRIDLRELDGNDVLGFLSQRWAQTSDRQPHPFDSDAIIEAFGAQKYPLKRAIEALNYILEEKLKRIPNRGDWPGDNSLAIDGQEIAMSLLRFRPRL